MRQHPRSAARLLPLLLLTLLTVGLRVLLPQPVIETWYARGLFVALREIIDAGAAWLPFPLFYPFWLGVVVWLGYLVRRWLVERREATVGVAWLGAGRRTLIALCWLVLTFLWLWGFNYGRSAVEDRLRFAVHEPELEELRRRVYGTATELSIWRARITDDTSALTVAAFPADLGEQIRPLLAAALLAEDYPAPGRPRAWELYPRGVLLRLSTAGVYWPWIAQGNLDAGLHPLQKPAVLAHELAHAYGFGDEGTCSFWAYLTAAQTENAALRYALELAYWRHLAGLLRYADPAGYLSWRERDLDPGIKNDLAAIYANGERYRDIAPALRDATYTAYLKAQGIHDGLLNYGRVVRLVEGYRRDRLTRRK